MSTGMTWALKADASPEWY